jgi:hypothetical protein
MASGIQFTNYVPQFLNGVNSPSPTLAAEVVTGLPIYTGAFPGNAFYLSEQQANQLSNNTCHAGWYMVVQVSASAVGANVAFGLVGHQFNLAGSNTAPGALLVTDASTGIGIGINPVVFLGTVTPGNYTIVQVAGDVTLQATAVAIAAAVSVSYGVNGKIFATPGAFSATVGQAVAGLTEAAVSGAGGPVRVNVSFPFGVI